MAAGYLATLEQFSAASANEMLGRLVNQQARAGFSSLRHAQTTSWQKQFQVLERMKDELTRTNADACRWHLLLEYEIPRRDKRIDTVLLANDVVFVIEFKIGATNFSRADQWQTLAYALDLRDFHHHSAGKRIVPILVATEAHDDSSGRPSINTPNALVNSVCLANSESLAATVSGEFAQATSRENVAIDPVAWNLSEYRPTQTIIEAARELFAGQEVRAISHNAAHNLTTTTDRIVDLIQHAKAHRKRVICFVTGIPGAGKTLAGLNAVHDARLQTSDELRGVFLSGNRPLVSIMREALARDCATRGATKSAARREVSTFIAGVHGFMNEYGVDHPERAPDVHVIVFDEAQRAWDANATSKKHEGLTKSESDLTLDIMERIPGWSVIVALVGGGQEIHRGEAGLSEWGRALNRRQRQWDVAVSPAILNRDESVAGHSIFEEAVGTHLRVIEDPALHLAVNVRSPRALWLGAWVNGMLRGKTAQAGPATLQEFPVVMTRSLAKAREWLRSYARSGDRYGLLARSGALRLRAEGIELSSGFRRESPYEDWFLAPPDDIRSSNQLEVAASEFECQGLELDWTAVCWGGDFVVDPNTEGWQFQALKGTKWQRVKKSDSQRYIENKYRVLLTRARQGMIIWVPEGDANDSTRDRELFDATASFLHDCGLSEI